MLPGARRVAGTMCNRSGSNFASLGRWGVGFTCGRLEVWRYGSGSVGDRGRRSVDGRRLLSGLTGGPSSAVRGLIQRHIEASLGKRGGAPVFRGTRIPISSLSQYLNHGYTVEDVIDRYDIDPDLIREVYRRKFSGEDESVETESAEVVGASSMLVNAGSMS